MATAVDRLTHPGPRPRTIRAAMLGIALLLIMVTSGLAYRSLGELVATGNLVAHTQEVLYELEQLAAILKDAEAGQRGFLLTRDERFLEPYRASVEGTPAALERLRRLTGENPNQQALLPRLEELVTERLALLAEGAKAGQAGRLDLDRIARGQAVMDQVEAVIEEMAAEESSLLRERDEQASRGADFARALLAGATLSSVLMILGVFALMGQEVGRRRRAEAALQETNVALEERVRERTAEIAQKERFLEAVLETMQDAIFVNREHRVVFFNGACLLLFGAADRDQLLGRSSLELFDPAYNEVVAERIKTLTEEGRPVPPIEERIVRLDGRAVDVEVAAAPFADDQGQAILVILRDLTGRKAIEQQLRQAQRMEAVGQLTGGIAHDFNNLLSVVVGNLDLLLEDRRVRDEPDLEELTQEALNGALRGAELTQRLLAFARKQPLQPQVIDINERLPALTALLRRTLGESITVTTVPAAGLWPALVDPGQLDDAIVNLAINARDAMPAGGMLTIETASARLDAAYAAQHAEVTPGEYVMTAITDTGTGMAPEVAERAFEPFFTTKAPGKGTGLGLSMVHGFVKQSRGHIKIYSEPGHGTTVRIYLPRAETGTAAALAPDTADEPLPRGRETVLLVEDNPEVRRASAPCRPCFHVHLLALTH